MYLPRNLRYLRLKNGFSQEYISDKLGYKSYTTIQKWEMGTSEPSISILQKLSKIYNIDMDTMYKIDLEYGNEEDLKFPYKKIPILGQIAAGSPVLAEENIEEYFNIDTKIKADFALQVKGDSMINANIFQGDIVFIRKQSDLENGEIGAILIDDEATLKKFYRSDGNVILQAQNDNYKPIILTNGDVRVLGKMVAVLHINY